MYIVAEFDPSLSADGEFRVQQSSGNGSMVVWNESNISLQLSWPNGYSAYVPAWTAVLYSGNFGGAIISWMQKIQLSQAGAPSSQVVIEIYEEGEYIPQTFPVALSSRATNVGNSVSTSGGGSTTLQNDGNPVGTQIVEATPAGDGMSAVSLLNSGHLSLGTVTNPGQLQILGSIGNVLIATTGVVSIDDRLLVNLIQAETGNDLLLGVATGHKIGLQINGVDVVDIDANNVTLLGAHLIMPNNVALQMKNTTAVAHDVLYVDNANEVKLQMVDSTKKLYISDASGNNLFSIDSSGNVRAKGTITPSVTP